MSHKSRSALERAMARTLDAFARRAAAGGGGSEKSGIGDGVVVLSQSRAVVRLSGSDSAKLLQGLVTNDVDVLAKWEKAAGTCTAGESYSSSRPAVECC